MQTAQQVSERLRLAGCVAAEAEAVELLADDPDESLLESRIVRREAGEPLAWITGWATFCDLRIRVTPGVYAPRPQTEVLARRAAAVLPETGRALDLCTGTGAIAAVLRADHPNATVVATDIDPVAVACARANGISAVTADLAAPLRRDRPLDVITAVAPYVPTDELAFLPSDVRDHEPRTALDGGTDGVTIIERIVDAARILLGPDGHLLLEIGGHQDEVLTPLLHDRFARIEWWHDEDGDLRGVQASTPNRSS